MSAASDKWMKEYLASRKGQVGNFMGDTAAQLQVNSQEIRDPANAQDLGSLFRERERLGGLETPIDTAGIPIDSPEAQSLLAQSSAQRQGALSRVAADVLQAPQQAPQEGPLSRYKAQEREPVDIEAMLARYVPQDGSSNKYLAIAAALARPLRTDSFGEKLGNIADALMTQKQEQQKLRAQYLPAIMTQVAQQQARQENQAYQAEQAYLARQQHTADMREKNTAKAEQAEQQRAFLQAMAGDKAEAARIQQQTAIASRVQPPEPPAQIITTPDGVFERTRDGALKALVDPATGKSLSGKPPSGAAMSVALQKELMESDDVAQSSRVVIGLLNKALDINDAAYSGWGAKGRALVRSNLPGASADADATINLDNIMTGQALESLKAVFGGMPTEGERKILLDIQASVDKTPAQRKAIIERAVTAAETRGTYAAKKAKAIRSGSYLTDGMPPADDKPPASAGSTSGIPSSADIAAEISRRAKAKGQ